MAKKQRRQNKKQKGKTSAQPHLSTTELENRFHNSLERFAYRPAIKFAKELHRREPDKYQSLLIKALQGLYRELSNKDQTARAATIMEQIKNLGESSATDTIELSLALQNGVILPQHEKIAVGKMAEWESGELTDSDKNVIIDILLIATTLDQPQAAEPVTQPLVTDILAIRNAFKLICDKQYAAATEEVNGIKRNSHLAPWRLLIKGITAFYLGDDEKALTAFRKLPARSTPAELGKAYLFLLKDTETCRQFAKKELFLQKVSLLAADEEVAKFLPRAEILWNTGRYRDSYSKIEPFLLNIDQTGSSLQNRLLRFYYNSPSTMNDDQQQDYIHFLSKKLFSPKNKCPAQLQAAYIRNAALYEETCFEGEEIAVKLWDSFLEICNRIQPASRAFTAAVYAHQAGIFAELQELDQDIVFSPQKIMAAILGDQDDPKLEPIDPHRAEVLYRRAIKTDPDNLEIRLKLLELFEDLGNKAKAKTNRLLDELIRSFPDNKEILTKTGVRCLERKAFPKGLKYLYQAARLDATDNKIKEYIILGSINYAWKLTLADNQKRCRELLAETLPFCVAKGQHLTLSPALLRARWAVFALFHDQVEEGKQELATALTADNSLDPDEVLYFFRLYAGVHNIPKEYLKGSETELNKVFRRVDNLDRLITFTKIILYNNQVSENDTLIKKELSRLIKALKKLTKKITSPKQCLAVVEFAQSHLVDNHKLALAFLRQGQRKFPDDLEIRLVRLSLEMENSRSIPTYKQMDQLNDLIEQAKTTENHRITRKAVELVEHFERKINWHRSFNNFENLYGNDEDYDDDETEEFDDEVVNEVVDEFFDSVAERLPPGASKPPKNWPRRRTRK
ncbi:MAG: tetratricopeptide repeat protein [Pseudomonadota bacterium]|nr:tetratricopeptide repeat protein [Pseudomonadota bacterium]